MLCCCCMPIWIESARGMEICKVLPFHTFSKQEPNSDPRELALPATFTTYGSYVRNELPNGFSLRK